MEMKIPKICRNLNRGEGMCITSVYLPKELKQKAKEQNINISATLVCALEQVLE